jgi:hypothetical protein
MPAVDVLPATNKLITDVVLFVNLTVLQLVKNLPEFLANPRLITVLKESLLCPYSQLDLNTPWPYPIC